MRRGKEGGGGSWTLILCVCVIFHPTPSQLLRYANSVVLLSGRHRCQAEQRGGWLGVEWGGGQKGKSKEKGSEIPFFTVCSVVDAAYLSPLPPLFVSSPPTSLLPFLSSSLPTSFFSSVFSPLLLTHFLHTFIRSLAPPPSFLLLSSLLHPIFRTGEKPK